MALRSAGRRTTTMLAAIGLVATLAAAQEHAAPAPADHQEGQERHGEEAHGEEPHHSNALGIILGGTYESEEDDTFFTWGVEYERLFSRRFALLLGVEHINEIDAWVVLAPLVYRFDRGGRLYVGPGLELKTRRPERDREPRHGAEVVHEIEDRLPAKQENLFLWRFGAGWTFEVHERYAISPTVSLDFVREEGHWVEALVFNVGLGFEF